MNLYNNFKILMVACHFRRDSNPVFNSTDLFSIISISEAALYVLLYFFLFEQIRLETMASEISHNYRTEQIVHFEKMNKKKSLL